MASFQQRYTGVAANEAASVISRRAMGSNI